MNYNFDNIKQKLKTNLTPQRFLHTLGVVESAERLAVHWHADIEKARLAALLHDCAKFMPMEERIPCCQQHGFSISDAERDNLTLLHAKCGAVLAREEYGVEDEEIAHAIIYHTTGCPGMTLLDKIIFIADYIEPNRDKATNLELVRKVAFENLDLAVLLILEDSLAFLNTKNRTIDPTTAETFDYYKKIVT